MQILCRVLLITISKINQELEGWGFLELFILYPIEKIDRMYTIKLEVHILFPLLNYAESFCGHQIPFEYFMFVETFDRHLQD